MSNENIQIYRKLKNSNFPFFRSRALEYTALIEPNSIRAGESARVSLLLYNTGDSRCDFTAQFEVPTKVGVMKPTHINFGSHPKAAGNGSLNARDAEILGVTIFTSSRTPKQQYQLSIWVDAHYTGQSLVRFAVGSQKRGMTVKFKVV